jgi:ADP-ribose pyrophosphatase YjhB (NUDIX family)
MPEKRMPRVTSAILVMHDNKFLLGKRKKKNAFGKWLIPGGGVQYGETALTAGVRELKEETNIDADIKRFIGVKEIIATHADYHTIVFFNLAEAINPDDLKSSDDLSEVGFFTVDQIKEMDTLESVPDVLKDAGFMD